ncbi:MAG: hypothetical protein HY077_17015 [Elusimicrobia bacterium]|nr:hypothetical protein [Elusimicrobiota bacterium]
MIEGKTARAFALGFASGAGVALMVAFFPAQLVDRFYERQIESKAVAVWERQAVSVSYEECRQRPSSCLGKIVRWPVGGNGSGSYWGGTQSSAIRWRNKSQVPRVGSGEGALQAVARVVGIEPDAVVLLYIGTPQAVYGGTTWKEKFGAAKAKDESFAF